MIAEIQQAVWSVNGNLPVASVNTMQQIYAKSLARTSFTLAMLAIAGTMALALGIIGIYGVISYSVLQRTREIGIRVALGAQKNELKWMFVRSALTLTVAGVAVGVVAAAMLTQSMKSLLFGIGPLDPITYLTVPLVLSAAAALASYFPARRAAAINPVEALQSGVGSAFAVEIAEFAARSLTPSRWELMVLLGYARKGSLKILFLAAFL